MKSTVLSLAVLLVIGTALPAGAQRHRHTPRTAPVATATAAPASSDDDDSDELVAYSDTVSAADTDSLPAYNQSAMDDEDVVSRFNDRMERLASGMFRGFFGSLIGVLFIVLLVAFFFMPLIIVLLVLRYLSHRQKDRVRLAEKAMETGQPLTDEQMPLSRKSPEYMWRRGVRNVSIGVGLMLFFWFLGTTPLMGIGALVACLGVGQAYIARQKNSDRHVIDDERKWTDSNDNPVK